MCPSLIRSRSAAAGCRQLRARVHALRLHWISSLVNRDAIAVGDQEPDRVRQVELTLRIVRRQPVEHLPQPLRPEHVDRRVDLADLELLGGRVARLDDRGQRRRLRPAARGRSAAGPPARRRGPSRSAPSRRCAVDEVAQELGSSARGCRPRGRARRPRGPRARRARCGPRRRSRAARPGPRPRRRRTPSAVAGRGHDHERFRPELARDPDDPVDHPATEQRMQMLGGGRAHSCPEACGHHDRSEPLLVRRHGGWGARIRTWDHGTKTRCLTTWPRPRARSSCQPHPPASGRTSDMRARPCSVAAARSASSAPSKSA